MVRELSPVEVDSIPELSRLVDEVRRMNARLPLRRAGEDVAVLAPARPRRSRRRRSTAREAALVAERTATLTATFGEWKDLVDAEALKRELAEAQSDSRDAVQL